MARCDERVLAGLTLQLEHEQPELARALTAFSSTDPPSRRRCWSGRLLLAAAVALMGTGIALGLACSSPPASSSRRSPSTGWNPLANGGGSRRAEPPGAAGPAR